MNTWRRSATPYLVDSPSADILMNRLPGKLEQTIVDRFQDEGVAWLKRLPETIGECERRWSLSAGPPFENLSYNYIAPSVRADGAEVILKLGYPDEELTCEIAALNLYDGRGCARLLDADQEKGVMLLERLNPGATLLQTLDDDEVTRVVARVMQQLWRPVPAEHPFPTVGRWALGFGRMRERFRGGTGPLPRDLVDKAEGLFAELLDSSEDPVVLHGDLHQENILNAQRQPWLAIDPKGVVGEPAYEVGALLRNMPPEIPSGLSPSQVVARRVDILAAELGFDRQRLLSWGLAQAVLSAWWSIEDHDSGWEWAVRCAELTDEVLKGRGRQ
jgi:streptomycin 6-kinase